MKVGTLFSQEGTIVEAVDALDMRRYRARCWRR